MNKAETIQLLSYLATNYPEISKKEKEEKNLMVFTWQDCLKDYDYNIVMRAVKELMMSNMFVPKLAEIVNLAKEYKKAMVDNVPKLKSGKCNKCKGKGLITYIKEVEKRKYLYVARCTCDEGLKYAYDGRKIKDERYRSNYYVPVIDEVMGV